MAKKIVKSTTSREALKNAPAAYFKSLTLENVKCFKGEQTIDLSDRNGKPAHWTVILGNNNTGKTTILKALSLLEPAKTKFTTKLVLVPSDYTFDFTHPNSRLFNDDDNFSKNQQIGVYAEIYLKNIDKNHYEKYAKPWHFFNTTWSVDDNIELENLQLFPFAAIRKMATSSLSENEKYDKHAHFFEGQDLENVEEWILQLTLAENQGQQKAGEILNQIRKIIKSGLLPDLKNKDFEVKSEQKGVRFENFVLFDTDYGKLRLRDLGYGYQSMMAWVLDLVRRMVERYPDSKNPLEEPAIVLVDEIDLHLHPEWQRKIIAHLTKYFPNTQFIVTAHSPLIVQSAENINVVILRKEGDHTLIEQPKMRNFRGWTVEEILSDLMDLDGKTMSETYLNLVNAFTEGIENDDVEKSQNAYNALDKILHPRSELRKLFRLEMTALTPLSITTL